MSDNGTSTPQATREECVACGVRMVKWNTPWEIRNPGAMFPTARGTIWSCLSCRVLVVQDKEAT